MTFAWSLKGTGTPARDSSKKWLMRYICVAESPLVRSTSQSKAGSVTSNFVSQMLVNSGPHAFQTSSKDGIVGTRHTIDEIGHSGEVGSR